MGSRNAVVIGSWWLLREMELANVRARLVTNLGGPVLAVSIDLPASKMDSAAQGAVRTHACVCDGGAPAPDCPVHAVLDQLLILRGLFPGRFAAGAADFDLPLFPDAAGRTVSKYRMTATIVKAATLLGVPLEGPTGGCRISGHTLRVTGAQGLTRIGLDIWAVQLLGRWGSSAVFEYVRDSAVSPAAAMSRRFELAEKLRELRAAAGTRG